MKHLSKFIVGLMLMSMASVSVQAQDAFYVYQNDGHFDGFFYDEVEKIRYSKTDTLGFEHEVYVSQEIVTADSTSRFMLTAIDSIGFVQPEFKLNPRLHIIDYHYDPDLNKEYEFWSYLDETDPKNEIYYFRSEMPNALRPKVDDVFASFDIEDGFSCKIASITTTDDGRLACHMKTIDDITDIFQQFITVEEYGYDREGNLKSRRVAGCPELTVTDPAKAKTRGSWEGDLFNFSINGHIPLASYDENGNKEVNITLDTSLDGKLHLKTAWNFSTFGSKYISVETNLSFGIGMGFTIDGKLKDFFPSGIGQFADVPIPANFPLFVVNTCPDGFIRGEAHITFNLASPKLKGGMWTKIAIRDWSPSFSMGFGSPGGEDGVNPSGSEGNDGSMTMSLSGFVQTGMVFPFELKTLPIFGKFFSGNIEGRWYVGPKIAANISLDMTSVPWKEEASYDLFKGTSLQFHLLDADYEVKAKTKTLFSGEQNVTLADGSFSLFPPFDASLVPEFGHGKMFYEKTLIDGKIVNQVNIGFEPNGFVVMPVAIGVQIYRIKEDGSEELWAGPIESCKYYHLAQLMGQEVDKYHWARTGLFHDEEIYDVGSNKGIFRAKPVVWPFDTTWAKNQDIYVIGRPSYDFEFGNVEMKTSSDTLCLKYDLSTETPITITGSCDKVFMKLENQYEYITLGDHQEDADIFVVTGGRGSLQLSVDRDRLPYYFQKNYNPYHKHFLRYDYNESPKGAMITEAGTFLSDPIPLVFSIGTNDEEDPHIEIRVGINQINKNVSVTRLDNRGWHFEGSDDAGNHVSFDLVVKNLNGKGLENGEIDDFVIRNGIYKKKISDNETKNYTFSGNAGRITNYGNDNGKLGGNFATDGGNIQINSSFSE